VARGKSFQSERLFAVPCLAINAAEARGYAMNNIVYIVGLVVIVLAILAFFGFR
jgi:hypothetical protein